MLAFAMWKMNALNIDEAAFRQAWHKFLHLRAANRERQDQRMLVRELAEFENVIARLGLNR